MRKINVYYPKYNGRSNSIVDALKSIGIDSSKTSRAKIALYNGIKDYTGTSAQNTSMLKKLKNGKLIKAIVPCNQRLISLLASYSNQVRKYGKYFYYSYTNAKAKFSDSIKEAKARRKTGYTCVVPIRQALNDMGINYKGFYAKNGSFKHCYKGDIKEYFERITEGGPIGKTCKQAVDEGLLDCGCILTFENATHTFAYSGSGYMMYDGGHAANYPVDGILVDYSKYYVKRKISEMLVFK